MKNSRWPSLLAEFIEGRMFKPFAWGVNDCAMFCADWIHTATGVDPAAEFRGTYSSEAEADAVLARFLGSIEYVVGGILKRHESVHFAKRGDIVMFMNHGRRTLGIVDLHGSRIMSPGKDHMEFFYIGDGVCAWEVD